MNKDDFKKVIDHIDIPDDQLEAIKSSILLKKKRNYDRYVFISAMTVIFVFVVITQFHFQSPQKTEKYDNHFISEIYAYDQSYELKNEKIEIEMNENMLASRVHSDCTRIDDEKSEYKVRTCVPLDIQIKGENIKSITYQIEKGENIHFYHVISTDLIADQMQELKETKDTYVLSRGYEDLREKDKKRFTEIFQEECTETNYSSHILDLSKLYHQKMNETNMAVETIKQYGWIYLLATDSNQKLKIKYNQQDAKDYKIELAKVYTITENELEKTTTQKQTVRVIKDSLIQTHIKISIQYQNDTVKEKTITFKEVAVSEEDMLPEEYGSRIYMEIQ